MRKQQIIVIHGGTTFNTHKDYISYLKSKEITLEKLKIRKEWKNNLTTALGDNFEVLLPRMPNTTNARYSEWKLWFERIIPFLNQNIIIIGHSLGGIFIAKYLSENNFPKRIKATILIAAPFDKENSNEPLVDFALPSSLVKFVEQGGNIYLMQSKDDPIIKFEQVKKYKQALPSAKEIIFHDREHFNQEEFPEIVELIKKI